MEEVLVFGFNCKRPSSKSIASGGKVQNNVRICRLGFGWKRVINGVTIVVKYLRFTISGQSAGSGMPQDLLITSNCAISVEAWKLGLKILDNRIRVNS